MLARFDRSGANGVGSAAADWVNLDDRMNFITNLFVSRHHRFELFQPPFDGAVVTDIEAGRIPGQQYSIGGSRPRRRGRPPPTIGTRRFTDTFLEGLRTASDWPADQAVSTFFEDSGEGHAQLFARLAQSFGRRRSRRAAARHRRIRHRRGTVAGLGRSGTRPKWPEVLPSMGAPARHGAVDGVIAGRLCLREGAEPLARTARLTGKPKRRYVETGQMIINAMTPGALETGALGYKTIRHVRLMHAAVRHLLLHGQDLRSPAGDPIEAWDDALGVPLNQEDLIGCLFSFSVVGVDSLRRSGVRVQ